MKSRFQTACYFQIKKDNGVPPIFRLCIADIDLRGFKVEAVEFLLQPFFITLNDFEDVGVDLAVCNQWIAQASSPYLMIGELAVLFHHGDV